MVRLADLLVDIAQKPEGEPFVLAELRVRLLAVEGGAKDYDTESFKVWDSVTEPLALTRSAGAGGYGEPPKHDPLAAEIAEGDRVTGLVLDGEIRRFRTDFEQLLPRLVSGMTLGLFNREV